MSLPAFYQPANAGRFDYAPDFRAVFSAATELQDRIRPAYLDRFRMAMLIIDSQRDFCHPEGTLYVGGRDGLGAINDSRRIAEFIYGNLAEITTIAVALDTHQGFHIFSPSAWRDSSGARLQPFSVILAVNGRLRWGYYDHDGDFSTAMGQVRLCGHAEIDPRFLAAEGVEPDLAETQLLYYCETLARGGKYVLNLWPEHCLSGSLGHALVGVIDEARRFWSYVRGTQGVTEMKGQHAWTESYSIFHPEVSEWHDGKILGHHHDGLLDLLVGHDALLVCGQAGSHCVRASIDDILARILAIDPALTGKVHIATDLTSAVTVPDDKGGFTADFTPVMLDSFKRWQDAGMQLVESSQPIRDWPIYQG